MKRIMILAAFVWALPCAVWAEETAAGSALTVEIKLGTDVNGHDLVGEADAFDGSTDKIVGWTLVRGAAEPTEIQHEWIRNGAVVASMTLPVKSSHFRTYSRKSVAGLIGPWTFQVKDNAGRVLGSKNFEITSRTEAPAK